MFRWRHSIIAFGFAPVACFAQHSVPDTLHAIRLAPEEHVIFDGSPDEAFWQRAVPIRNFTQHDPHVDQPATDSTVVRVVYDDQALYFAAVLGVQDMAHIQAKYMERDFAWYKDDNFQLILSPFNDKRTGYIFVTNMNGARTDMLIANSDRNIDWNGVWDVQAQCTPFGWTCEIRIPFSTLQFRKGEEQIWAINFERNVRIRNEQINWQGWGRNTSIENLATAGTLSGLKNIGYSKRFELKPYGLGGVQDRPAPSNSVGKIDSDLVNLIIPHSICGNLF